jgi:regulator of protease activity HflC (stomatin/prohibitin superfamily)
MDDEGSDEETGIFPAMATSKNAPYIGICCCCCVLIWGVIYPLASLKVLDPGEVGVVTTFGSVSEDVLSSGAHVINPFASVTRFSTRTILFEEPMSVPTVEGLNVNLDVAILYHIHPWKAREIYTTIGEEYEATFMKPQLASAVRGLTGSNPAEALYNSTRERLQMQLNDTMREILAPRGITVESVLLKEIVLPQLLKDAIEQKTASEQEAERMVYVLQKAEQEASRKAIEAQGIQTFQNIVSQGISPALLQWKGIEATEKMSESKNQKLIVIGNSDASLPVMMSNTAI